MGGDGIIQLCGSDIGGLSVVQHQGDVEIIANDGSCLSTTLTARYSASLSTGDVTVAGANLPNGDFLVSVQNGCDMNDSEMNVI